MSERMHRYMMGWLWLQEAETKKGSNGRLSTIPILNVFGRLERRSGEVEKGKKKKRYRAKTKLSPSCGHGRQNAAAGCVRQLLPTEAISMLRH